MKKIGILLMCVATLAFASCGAMQNVTSSNAAAQATGLSCAQALASLYNSYKTNGKLSLTNATELQNAIILAQAYSQLKQNKGNAEYRKAFTQGMISAGTGLITTSNADSIVNSIANSTGLENASSVSNTVQTAASINQILQNMK